MKELELKYGCNPNQKPARIFMAQGELPVQVLNGKPAACGGNGFCRRVIKCGGVRLQAHVTVARGLFARLDGGLHQRRLVIGVQQVFQRLAQLGAVLLAERLANALGHRVVEVRHALAAVLVILIGLNGNGRQRRIAGNALRLAQIAVPGAHAIHNGFTAVPETHSMYHGEKVAFGTLVQLVLENASEEELEEVLSFCEAVGLPTTLRQLGIEQPKAEQLMEVAKLACADSDTLHNMPFEVTDIAAAFDMVQKMEYPVLEKGICFLPFWQNGVRFFTICGPQGERVEFSQIL